MTGSIKYTPRKVSHELTRLIASQLEDMDVEADDYWGDCWDEDWTPDSLYHWTDCIQSMYEDRYYTFDDWVYCNSLDNKSWFDDWWFDDDGQPCYRIEIIIQP
jgi:hypothetical protein